MIIDTEVRNMPVVRAPTLAEILVEEGFHDGIQTIEDITSHFFTNGYLQKGERTRASVEIQINATLKSQEQPLPTGDFITMIYSQGSGEQDSSLVLYTPNLREYFTHLNPPEERSQTIEMGVKINSLTQMPVIVLYEGGEPYSPIVGIYAGSEN